MINREELERLIEKGETVYGVINGQLKEFDEDDRKHFEIINDFVYLGTWYDDFDGKHYIELDDLYKTKSDAQWVLDTHTTRTETYEPPTWEEFCNNCMIYSTFDKKRRFMEILGIEYHDTTHIYLIIYDNNQQCHREFSGCLTKENYTKAVMLGKKLFEGESDVK